MKTSTKIKTIDIYAKEWFDKVNGNSYHSARIVLNYGQPDEQTLTVPFTYGYGDHYLTTSEKALFEAGILKKEERLCEFCAGNGVILRRNKQEKCLKRDVVAFGFGQEI